MAKIFSNSVDWKPCRLVSTPSGLHQFGGHADYSGVVPAGQKVPLQLVLLFDLSDALVPFKAEGLKRLPLFYPFKYGEGGGEVQYEVLDDNTIRIIHIWGQQADPPERQYVQVGELPRMSVALDPLTYEQARALALHDNEPSFNLNAEDERLIRFLKRDPKMPLVRVGGGRILSVDKISLDCHNSKCACYNRAAAFRAVVVMPPVPVNGVTSFWHEFEGTLGLNFCFGICWSCNTILAFNRFS